MYYTYIMVINNNPIYYIYLYTYIYYLIYINIQMKKTNQRQISATDMHKKMTYQNLLPEL